MRTAVTGASGSRGGQVVRLLAEQADPDVVAITRRPAVLPRPVIARLADYGDLDALRKSLSDVDTLVLISSDGEATRVLAHHLNVVSAARDSGVGHIIALSSVDADIESPFCYAVTNAYTEQAIRDSGCGFSIVRASIFADFFRTFLVSARSTGRISLPAGDGRIGLVSKADVGRCMIALARSAPSGRCHDVTGPVSLSMAAVADTASEAWDRPVVYQPIGAAEHITRMATNEDPWWLYAYSSLFASIREQRWDRATVEVQQLTRQTPQPLTAMVSGTAPTEV
jgi:NAD(P)H dehydrogenase (quinone)